MTDAKLYNVVYDGVIVDAEVTRAQIEKIYNVRLQSMNTYLLGSALICGKYSIECVNEEDMPEMSSSMLRLRFTEDMERRWRNMNRNYGARWKEKKDEQKDENKTN